MKRYIDEFLGLRCAADLLAWGLFPSNPGKEVTETFATYRAVYNHVPVQLNDPSVALVSVGDGHTPRTAATFAVRSKWQCYSIDPALREKDWSGIQRLTIHRRKVEDTILDLRDASAVVIVAVHSHALLKAVLDNVLGRPRHLVTLPCCVPQEIPNRVFIGYQDTQIWSPKNTFRIWLDI